MLLRFTTLLLLLPFFSFQGAAQKACKPTLKENRGNYVVIQDPEVSFLKWNDPTSPNRVIVNYPKNGYDSISVSRNGHQITQFLAKADQIVSPRLVLTDEKGTLQSIDSFRPPFRFYLSNDYFGTFSGELDVSWEFYPSGSPSKVLYKNHYNRDSLTIYWSETGIIRRKKAYDTEYVYTPDGTLMTKRISGLMPYEAEFYGHGVLRSLSMDTMILNQQVEWKRDYSPKGILLQERWYKNDEPRGTWREYNNEGVLMKTVKHPPLVWEASDPYSIEELLEPEVATYVDEQAEFPEGMRAFKKYLEQGLADIFCQSDLPVSGNYFIHFEVNEQGKAVFVSVEGRNATNLEQDLKSYIEQLPKWRSAKHTGRPAVQGLVLPVWVHQ